MSEPINIVIDVDLTPLVPILSKAVAERKVRSVRCDMCDNEALATVATLKEIGWQLGPTYELCPKHE